MSDPKTIANFSPARSEVEALLLAHPDVIDASLIDEEGPDGHSYPVAYVVPHAERMKEAKTRIYRTDRDKRIAQWRKAFDQVYRPGRAITPRHLWAGPAATPTSRFPRRRCESGSTARSSGSCRSGLKSCLRSVAASVCWSRNWRPGAVSIAERTSRRSPSADCVSSSRRNPSSAMSSLLSAKRQTSMNRRRAPWTRW